MDLGFHGYVIYLYLLGGLEHEFSFPQYLGWWFNLTNSIIFRRGRVETTNQKEFSQKNSMFPWKSPWIPVVSCGFPRFFWWIFRPGEFQQPGLVVQLGKFCHFMPGRTRCAMGNSPWSASELGKAGQIIGNLWEIYRKSMRNLWEIYRRSMSFLVEMVDIGYRWIYSLTLGF